MIPAREALEAALAEARRRYPGDDVPRPGLLGRLPARARTAIEFWEGRPNRLHDRASTTCREPAGGWRDASALSP